ncbi:MAG: hypothetical protein HDKAJFGB_01467 [Anaerolineae bacterium]|nr:hypothetical protein [Anaerolineae bacterium]
MRRAFAFAQFLVRRHLMALNQGARFRVRRFVGVRQRGIVMLNGVVPRGAVGGEQAEMMQSIACQCVVLQFLREVKLLPIRGVGCDKITCAVSQFAKLA